jgi:putative transposase
MGESLRSVGKKNRVNEKRNESPSYGIIDSQSVKTIYSSDERGIDGGKKVKGRKRHIVVDVMGNLLAVVVHAANIHDTMSGIDPAYLAFELYPTIKAFCGDAGYRGTFIDDVDEYLGLRVDISERISSKFEVIPKRWVVERTFAWMGYSRRLSKDYEITTDSAEAMVMISHIHTLLKKLA